MGPCSLCCIVIFLCFSKKTAVLVTNVTIWTSAKQDYAEFMSGLDLGEGNAWTDPSCGYRPSPLQFHRLRLPVSCVCAKCNTGQTHLSNPFHAHLVPSVLSGIFCIRRTSV